MANTINIAQLNRPITINKYVLGQDDSGGNVKILVASYDLMACVQPISNSYVLEQLQLMYGEAYKIITRFEPSRVLTPNDDIVYNNNIHKIQGIRNQDEGAKRFLIINTATGNTVSNADSGGVTVPAKEYHYTGVGGEYSFQDDVIKGWVGIILLFRDSGQYRVIRSGTPASNQVLYDMTSGTFTFSNSVLPLAQGETVDAYLINA